MGRNCPFILWKLLLVAGFPRAASLLSVQGSFWCWLRQLYFLLAFVSFWQLNNYVFIRNTDRDTGALFPCAYWQHRSNGRARKVQIWWKWQENSCSLAVIPYVQQWASLLMQYLRRHSNILVASSVEIRLGRGLKFLLRSLYAPYSAPVFFFTIFSQTVSIFAC